MMMNAKFFEGNQLNEIETDHQFFCFQNML